jgi:hypothetical protein
VNRPIVELAVHEAAATDRRPILGRDLGRDLGRGLRLGRLNTADFARCPQLFNPWPTDGT